MDSQRWYFAYGSNMSRTIFVEQRKIEPLASKRGRIEHYRLSFNIPIGPGERAVANLEPEQGVWTHGVLYLLTSEQLGHLDHTEGVHFGLYKHLAVDVATDDGQRIGAVTYQSTRTQDGRKPSARYLGLLLDGAQHHGLPQHYIEYLRAFDLAIDEREGM